MSIARSLNRALVFSGVLLFSTLTSAQTGAPSADQLDFFEKLPETQRRAILENVARSGGAVTDTGLDFPETTQPLTPSEQDDLEALLRLQDELRIRDEDVLVLEFQVRGSEAAKQREAELAAAAEEQQQAALAGQPATTGPSPLLDEVDDEQVEERQERIDSDPRLTRLLGSRTYRLDEFGVLRLPALANIPLSGLNVEEAAIRIEAEPSLYDFEVIVTILPLEPVGVDALEPFGYDLFAGVPTTFAPATDIPVPPDYAVGPGDNVDIQLFGKENREYSLVVTRDGTLNIPEIGPVSVAGVTFSEMKETLTERIQEQRLGVNVAISMGALRSLRVLVLGESRRPGSYTVSALSTMGNALYASGGITYSGSLRNIQLRRGNQEITRVDLYDYLLRGNTGTSIRLQPEDVVFIPPVGPTVSIAGAVKRPAIYELNGETTVGQVLEMAGGLLPTAFPKRVSLERISGEYKKVAAVVDLTTPEGRNTRIGNGDVLEIDFIDEELEDSIMLMGHVYREGPYQWTPGVRLTSILGDLEELRIGADKGYILIRREARPSREVSVISADIEAALARPLSEENPLLEPGDEITVFQLGSGRRGTVEPLIKILERQSTFDSLPQIVDVGGTVRAEGRYPLETGMRISDLLRAGGGMRESAYDFTAELTRFVVVEGESRESTTIVVDLAAVNAGDASADILLQPYDYLQIKEIPDWRDNEKVTIDGEVKFPGTYPIRRGESLRSVLERAGGLTDYAFAEGSIFLRETLREREQEQIEILTNRLENDLAALSLRQAQGAEIDVIQAQSVGAGLLQRLRATRATGRLVIDLNAILEAEPGSEADVVLKDGDELIIPERSQEVTVIGEVQFPTSHLHASAMDRDGYIDMSGGLTLNADADRIYIVRANGEVNAAGGGSKWFGGDAGEQVRPGDTIVVPLDTDRLPQLVLWSSVTSIVYNLAVAVAAIGSL